MKDNHYSNFRKDLEKLINKNSMENGSETPDFLLAEFLTDCLTAYDRCSTRTVKWKNGTIENTAK